MRTNLVYGLTIKERVEKMQKLDLEDRSELNVSAFKTWRERPTLVDDAIFNELLKSSNLSEEEYGFGVRELTIQEIEALYNEVIEEDWVQLFYYIMNLDMGNRNIDASDFSFPLYKHLFYIEKKIRIILDGSIIKFSDEAIEKYLESIMLDLLDIALKTFVYDLQVFKDENDLKGKTETERFHNYLKIRFDKTEDLISFFCDYPALTRLISVKVQFIVNNFKQLLDALIDSEKELNSKFDLSLPFTVTDLNLGAGDTHDKGKTVSIIEINNKLELVCKPKNLNISLKFDQFICEIQKINPSFDFYSINRIVKANYTIEEKLPHKECVNEDEVQHFYRQFGQTIALIYLLNGNDFHFENIIAYGKYPLLIDLETIVQNYFPPKTDHAFEKFFIKTNESVLITGLLPMLLFDDRKEDDVESAGRGLQLSALSGDTQKIPFKMLRLVNYDTDNMQYEYQEQLMDGSENIPMLNGKKIDFAPYTNLIFEGFNEFSHFFIENKMILIKKAKEIFSDSLVRHVIKTTQNYTDMLSYSMHPTCMLAMCEREKVLENLWINYYTNNQPVPYEIRDMLQGDIPIFYCNTSTTSLIESEGNIIPNIYSSPGIDIMIDRMEKFDLNDLNRQEDFMRVALGKYLPNNTVRVHMEIKKDAEVDDLINFIAQKIIENSIDGENSITWPMIKEMGVNDFSIEMINENFYDGLTGIYLFLSQLYFYTRDDKYKRAYEKAESLVIELADEFIDGAFPSAFFGSLSAVYPLLLTYRETKERKYLDYVEIIAEDFIDNYKISENISVEWLNGAASTAVIYCHLYKQFKNEEYIDFAEELLYDLKIDSLMVAGFGHGYSGIMKACLEYLNIKDNEKVNEILHKALILENKLFDEEKQGWTDLRNDEGLIETMWCYGTVGVGFGRLGLLKSGYKSDVIEEDFHLALRKVLSQKKINSCICHGTMGDISFLVDSYHSGFVTNEEKRNIEGYMNKIKKSFLENGNLRIEGLESLPVVGLFTGLAGIGYELLRIQSNGYLPNVLTLDFPKFLGSKNV